ncbi:MAG TPA: hypothetical protein PKZ99_15320 [Azospirillaceae bacterium]|mgnify:CR=1 FL=1|nr:hypothetical protein [Azospirillaceae bacterium]
MSASEPPEAAVPAPKLKRRWRRWAYLAGGAAIAGGMVAALGPAAPWVVDHLADGQRVWRLGRINVDDVRGNWLGDLRAGTVTIADEEGVWLEATNVTLDWRPQDILFGAVRIRAGQIDSLVIHRQPRLLERRPSTGASIDVYLGDVRVDEISLAEATFGEAAAFTAQLNLIYRDKSIDGLNIGLRRTDSDADRLHIAYSPDENYELNLDAASAPGGASQAKAKGKRRSTLSRLGSITPITAPAAQSPGGNTKRHAGPESSMNSQSAP